MFYIMSNFLISSCGLEKSISSYVISQKLSILKIIFLMWGTFVQERLLNVARFYLGFVSPSISVSFSISLLLLQYFFRWWVQKCRKQEKRWFPVSVWPSNFQSDLLLGIFFSVISGFSRCDVMKTTCFPLPPLVIFFNLLFLNHRAFTFPMHDYKNDEL